MTAFLLAGIICLMFPKPNRKKDRKFLDSHHEMRCVACGKQGADPAHIQTRGAGAGDNWWEVMALCRTHHTLQGAKGWKILSDRYEAVAMDLKSKGWYFNAFNQLRRDKE